MVAICEAAIHLCAIRVTRLDALGDPVAGPNNVYVSENSIMLGVTPEIEAGQDRTLVGGCDCIIASYRGYDKLKRFTLELDQGKIEPALLEMLLGASAILDPVDPIGIWWPSQLDCNQPSQPNLCFEGWQDLWEDDHAASAGGYRYLHWIWPSSYWQIGEHSLQNDFMQPKVNGFTRANSNWGLGIFGDLPEAAEPLGGFFYDLTIPTADCGWQSWAIT